MQKRIRSLTRRGSALLLFVIMTPLFLIPMVGLAIDVTMLYIVQAKLSAAVDGAALGAGRLLGSNANTVEIAGEFLNANYPTGYWGSFNLVPNITYTQSFSTHVINCAASVDVPLLFMRLLGKSKATVGANAQATRRDSRVMLVLDRSYSMNANIGSMKTSAYNFVSMFTPGADELGLVVFGGSGFVAYPTTRPYSLTAGGGPDTHFADPATTGNYNMLDLINALQVGSDTNTSEALWLAYTELKKAAAIDNDPTRLNAIVLFTDGVPNGFTGYFNDPSNGAANNALNSTSNCKWNPASTTDTTTNLYGFMCSRGSGSGMSYFNPSSSTAYGLFKMLLFDTTNSAYYWVTHTTNNSGYVYVNEETQVSGTPFTNCTHLSGNDMSGLKKIPPFDYYGTSTGGSTYTNSVLYQTYTTAYNANSGNNGYHLGLASWMTTDNTARRILADTNLNIAIYTIGYTGNGGVDEGLLKRISNTQDSTSYNASYQVGRYVPAADANQLADAFNQVASEILRLAR